MRRTQCKVFRFFFVMCQAHYEITAELNIHLTCILKLNPYSIWKIYNKNSIKLLSVYYKTYFKKL